MCSSETFVSTTTRVASSTFVASCRPPSPASTAAASTSAARNATKAAAVSTSNCVASNALGRRPHRARAAPRGRPRCRRRGSAPTTSGRAATGTRPAETPCARSSSSTIRVVVDLPFVPTTWTAGRPTCGWPSSRSSARIRWVPKPSFGHGDRLSSQAGASRCGAAHRSATRRELELAAVSLELGALRLDDLGRRVRDEPLVREHALRAGDLLAQPRPLGLDVAVVAAALRAHDRGEDALLVSLRGARPGHRSGGTPAPPPGRGRARRARRRAPRPARATPTRSAARPGPGGATRSPPSRAASADGGARAAARAQRGPSPARPRRRRRAAA